MILRKVKVTIQIPKKKKERDIEAEVAEYEERTKFSKYWDCMDFNRETCTDLGKSTEVSRF